MTFQSDGGPKASNRRCLRYNVLVRALLSRSRRSPNFEAIRQWLVLRRLQLIISSQLLSEYLAVFDEVLKMPATQLKDWRRRLEDGSRATLVNLGRRFTDSRDPDHNLVLATAYAGNVDFLVTNDRDLLELPASSMSRFRFEVIKPVDFIDRLAN